jgi:hypothetical protein
MPSKRLTPLLGLAFLLACCAGSVKAQVKDLASSDPNRRYILPTYPALYTQELIDTKALINADLELELILDRNGLKATNVIFCNATDSTTMKNVNAFCKNFVVNIGYALGQWHFSEDSSTWNLKVSFRSIPTNDEDRKPVYYLYHVDGESLRISFVGGVSESSAFASTIPKEIIVEYHFPFKEFSKGLFVLKKKKKWYWPF